MTRASGDGDAPPPRLLSRRSALTGLAAATMAFAATGCGRDGGTRPPVFAERKASTNTATASDVAADVALLTAAIADEERLGSFYAAASERYLSNPPFLGPLADRQAEHVARLRASLTNLDPPRARGHEPLPRRGADFIPLMTDLAITARDARSADCRNASNGLLAQLFASIAACHAVTVALADRSKSTITIAWPQGVSAARPLLACLAAEHAAVYAYGVLGGVLTAGVSDTPVAETATSSYDVHRERRDNLTALIDAAGLAPVAAEATYDLPFDVIGSTSARRLAASVETRCSAVYAQATAETDSADRLLVSSILLDTACRAVRWGAEPTAFPGLVA